ncbi:SWI/SNF complex subunit like [Actinidia chinensis var. chinensis]|uniref:SWI/SNF complex subunit like n=1 Tax=Actinidia chinensis var. chinensis TaxID=1590841 RepID=A0A2R6S159_ACTCC|nr:SWI/SNF complex subunit like [Actinidia chinensis var. chinensis]
MSWLTRSIASSLRISDDDDDDQPNPNPNPNPNDDDHHHQSDPPSSSPPEHGVIDDLSDLTKTLTRQLWTFLAPPPQPQISDSIPREASESDPEASDAAIAGIRTDIAEIGGKFRSGISMLSNKAAVWEFTKIASNFLQFGAEEEGGAVGVTDEVVAFARDVAMHPETWMDFPLPEGGDDDDDDFEMSDAQHEHALAVESLAPRLAALRIELCPGYMSEGCFWKIYFVLVHPRLNKHDAELLSTPQIVKARALLTQELQNRTKAKPEQDWSGSDTSYLNENANSPKAEGISFPSNVQSESIPLETSTIKLTTSTVDADFETEKHQVQSTEIPFIDKSVVEEGPISQGKGKNLHSDSVSKVFDEKYEDDGDDWLKEESSEIVGTSGTTIPIVNEDDVSFSDLEEDDGDVPTSYKKVTYGSDSSTKESRDWVQLSRSSSDSPKDINAVSVDRVGFEHVSAHNPGTKETNDWLDLDEIDVE